MPKKPIRKKRTPRKNRRKLIFTLLFFAFFIASSAVYGFYHQYETARLASLEKIKANSPTEQPVDENAEFLADIENEEKVINVLLIGIDERVGEPSRTDVIMVAQYRPKEGAVKLASIMRDSYVTIPGYKDNKINVAYFFGGPELLRQTLKENFDIDIHYYATVNFDGFVQVVDRLAPNGIEVNVANRMYYKHEDGTIDFQPGLQTLDGEKALDYVRFRSDKYNDFGRVKRQQEIIAILKDELLSFSGLTRLPSVIGSLEPYVDTNMTKTKMLGLGKDFFLKPVKQFDTLTIPIPNSFADKSYPHAGRVLDLNIEENKQALKQFFDTPSEANDIDE